jgi:PhzF family phenazine biosynthesis protein
MRTKIPIYQVDAFADERFGGNPAAVCILADEYPDDTLQSIAAEMNLSETAFIYHDEKEELTKSREFRLRWFTPTVEVPLCGHATLASAAVLFFEIGIDSSEISFESKSGKLTATRQNGEICLNFPIDKPEKCDPPKDILSALGITSFEDAAIGHRGKEFLIRLQNEEAVRGITPDYGALRAIQADLIGIIVTSRGQNEFDFVSRFFGPWVGVDEDPVTGAAHTVLAPYWSEILGKKRMVAYQASPRGGKLIVELKSDDRVDLIGNAVTVLRGELLL